MILYVVIVICILYFYLSGFALAAYDQTTARANTLQDDADDIQRQLDNEARDRIKYGRPKTIWVFHFPTELRDATLVETVTRSMRNPKLGQCVKGIKGGAFSSGLYGQRSDTRALKKERKYLFDDQVLKKEMKYLFDDEAVAKPWSYKDQNEWPKTYPECGGRSQSPVDLPYNSLIKTKGARKMLFRNYDVDPTSLMLKNDGRTVSLEGRWKRNSMPFIYGGAAHSRRYIFHSMSLHWPSEHSVGGLQYPMESQALHISAEYKSMEEALNASAKDPLAFLAVANLYKYDNHTQEGLDHLLRTARGGTQQQQCLITNNPLYYYTPPFKEYACYQGSLTAPPCNEAVLWLIRARALSVTREAVQLAESLLGTTDSPFRATQPLNDRKTLFFIT